MTDKPMSEILPNQTISYPGVHQLTISAADLVNGIALILEGTTSGAIIDKTLKFFNCKDVAQLKEMGGLTTSNSNPNPNPSLHNSIAQYVSDILDDEDNKMEDNIVVDSEPLNIRAAVAKYLKEKNA